ncbi:MAG: hypothetical protein ACTHJ7_05175 [Candidatus Nitrosocosmicus sp.]
MSEENPTIYKTHFRQVPGLGLTAVVPKEWLNKKVKFEFREKEYEKYVSYRGRRSIICVENKTSNGGPVTIKLIS